MWRQRDKDSNMEEREYKSSCETQVIFTSLFITFKCNEVFLHSLNVLNIKTVKHFFSAYINWLLSTD